MLRKINIFSKYYNPQNNLIMKKLFLALSFVASVSAYSQIERVEQTKAEITSRISNVYLEKIDDVEYNFFYKNMNSIGHEYVKFSFKTLNNSYDLLYDILMEGFSNPPRDPVKIKANGEIVWLKYFKEDGKVKLRIQQYVDEAEKAEAAEGAEISEIGSDMTTSRPLSEEDVTNLFKKN